MGRTGPTNIHLRKLISKLEKMSKERNQGFYSYIAKLLNKPTRRRVEVNLSKINRLSADSDIIVVPGKVLGGGRLKKRLTIVAWKFSESAKKKILDSGSNYEYLEKFVENPEAHKNVKIII